MISILIYVSGLAALYATDLLITSSFSVDIISAWAEIRALIGISGTFCLVGLDLVIMRRPASSARLLRLLVVQVPLLAILVALVTHSLGYMYSYPQAYLLAIGSAGTIALNQYFRSHHMRSMAQLVQQGWRLAALGVVLALLIWPGLFDLGQAVVLLLVMGAIASGAAVMLFPPSRLMPQAPEPVADLYRIGSRFMVTSLFLATAVYAEQLVVIRLGTTQDAAAFFAHAAFFLFPLGILNGYAGFLLGPWVRDNHDHFISLLRRRWWALLLLVMIVAGISHGIGSIAWTVLAPRVGPPDTALRLFFLASSVIITLYQLPSAYNGAFARTTQHDTLIVLQVLSLACAAAVLWFGFAVLESSIMLAVAAASFVNWGLRTLSGFVIIAVVSREKLIRR